jgi:prophage regulatory protein
VIPEFLEGKNMALQILRRRDVEAAIGLGRSQLYAMIQRGEFPKPIKLGNGPTGAVGWLKSEVEGWLKERIAIRDHAETSQ